MAFSPLAMELLASAPARIEAHRKLPLQVCVKDGGGKPVAGAQVQVLQTRHGFGFGNLVFDYPTDANVISRFLGLYNYATLPFYWKGYEASEGDYQEAHLRKMATWCRDEGIAVKGHPLVWHEVVPAWLDERPDAMHVQEARVRREVASFAGLVDRWDVINEATVSHRFKNFIGQWHQRDGAAKMIEQAHRWAREANPQASLVVNDFNVFDDTYEQALEQVVPTGLVDVIGIQSHMNAGTWDLELAWARCEKYARFGLPLHFTELTVVSGNLKPQDSNWYSPIADWETTTQGEQRQAEYLAALYTLLFSHPAVEAITYWGLKDPLWLNSPGGLLRKDGSVKPAYEALHELIRQRWWTRESGPTDSRGVAECRAFWGTHTVKVTVAGQTTERVVDLGKGLPARVDVTV